MLVGNKLPNIEARGSSVWAAVKSACLRFGAGVASV
jgi:hypothetical protein